MRPLCLLVAYRPAEDTCDACSKEFDAATQVCSEMASATGHEHENVKPEGPALTYMSGFGAEFQSEALPGALPVGQNTPQKVRILLFVTELFLLQTMLTCSFFAVSLRLVC